MSESSVAILVKDDNTNTNTRSIIEWIDESIDDINAGGIYIEIIPVNDSNVKKILNDGINRYPTALYNQKKTHGVDNIKELICDLLENALKNIEQKDKKVNTKNKNVCSDFDSLLREEMTKTKMLEDENDVKAGNKAESDAVAKAQEWNKRRQAMYNNNPNNMNKTDKTEPTNQQVQNVQTKQNIQNTQNKQNNGGNIDIDTEDLLVLDKGDYDDRMMGKMFGNNLLT